ncbi:MAG: hypothetical protein A2Y72_04410 [Chloroflexi bacterium RBG_13_53_26]|nr:MAG: hypothetical protein A2Y72_04410 [Chloroflexi bacterium RBG_13_53_26]
MVWTFGETSARICSGLDDKQILGTELDMPVLGFQELPQQIWLLDIMKNSATSDTSMPDVGGFLVIDGNLESTR